MDVLGEELQAAIKRSELENLSFLCPAQIAPQGLQFLNGARAKFHLSLTI